MALLKNHHNRNEHHSGEVKVSKEDRTGYLAAQASYGSEKHHKELEAQGYTLDTELSDERHKVYAGKNDVLIGYRGTVGDLRDLRDDAGLAVGNLNTEGFRTAVDVATKAKKKHKKELVHAGHSLGGTKALQSQKYTGGRTVAFNPGTSIGGEKTDQSVYVNGNDVIANRIKGKNVKVSKKKSKKKGVIKKELEYHTLSQFE